MPFKEYLKNNKIFLISIFLYILITFPFMLNHIPWYDEAHAYMQAYFMNLHNWLDIIRAEGHPLLWFLILMPFAKTQWHYPYPMLLINYITCLVSIMVMWHSASFNKWLKLGITFSSMFLIYFPIVARGYSLGILLLFLLSALYKNKLGHPYLYPILVGLTLNLNIMCGIGASWFGIIYFIELLKSNLNTKTKIASCFILVCLTLLFVSPFLLGFGNDASSDVSSIGLNYIWHFFISPPARLILFLSALVLVFIKTHFCKEQSFILYSYTLFLCIFALFYPGGPHHFIFLFVYLIIFLWIYADTFAHTKNVPCINSKIDFLTIILMLQLFIPLQYNMTNIFYGHKIHTKQLVNIFNTEEKYRNGNLYLYEREALIIPYLNKDIKVFNACNNKGMGWDMFDTHNCIPIKDLQSVLKSKDKNTFLITSPDIHSKQFDNEFKIYEYLKESKKNKEN